VVPAALAAADTSKQWIHVNKTDRADFAPGGTIRITGSHGDLTVEGWDRPEVEVSVNKSTVDLYPQEKADEARQRLDKIAVTLEKKSATELTIATAFPSRTLRRLNRGKSDLILEYRIHVPRDSRIVVQDDLGTVLISEVTGDLEARVGHGDDILMLPASEGYSIDASTKFGNVESDFGGAANRRGFVGRQLAFAPASVKRRVFARVGNGGITVMAVPAAHAPS
jgi:hypothetical protein